MLIWHGDAEAFRRTDEQWERAPSHDYELTVVQRRYADRWESTKHMHRRHPDYDGSAGPRDQTHHFTIHLNSRPTDKERAFSIDSTLGDGEGRADLDFTRADMRLHAAVSSFAPFDTYVIEQEYHYGAGKLAETVRLVNTQGKGGASDWFRVEESAELYAPARFEHTPTATLGPARKTTTPIAAGTALSVDQR